MEGLEPGRYRVSVAAPGFAESVSDVWVAVSSVPTLSAVLKPQAVRQAVKVEGTTLTLATQPIETNSSASLLPPSLAAA